MKYYFVNFFFFAENVHRIEQLVKISQLFVIAQTSFKCPENNKKGLKIVIFFVFSIKFWKNLRQDTIISDFTLQKVDPEEKTCWKFQGFLMTHTSFQAHILKSNSKSDIYWKSENYSNFPTLVSRALEMAANLKSL